MSARLAYAPHPTPLPDSRDLAESVARVVVVDRGVAWLEAEPKASCSGCLSAATCSPHASAASAAARRFPLHHPADLQVGERVVVGLAHSSVVRAAGTAYGVPLLTMLGAGIAAQLTWADDGLSALSTLLGLAAGLGLARLVSLWLSRRGDLSPQFLRRLPAHRGQAEALSCSPCDEHP